MNAYHRLSVGFASGGAYLFAAGIWLSTASTYLGLLVITIGVCMNLNAWRWLAKQPIFWLSIVACVGILLSTWRATLHFPTTSELQWKYGERWLHLFLFFPLLGCLAHQDRRLLKYLPWVAVAAFTLSILVALDWRTVDAVLHSGYRFGGRLGKSIVFGFYSSFFALGIVTLGARLLFPASKHKLWLSILLWVLLAIMLGGLLASKSRGPMLAAAIVFPCVVIALSLGRFRHTIKKHKFTTTLAAALFCAAFVYGAQQFWQRFETDVSVIADVWDKGLNEAELTNATWRFHMWRFGVRKWTERPLLGWGPGSTRAVIATVNNPALTAPGGKYWDHLHSAYAQMLFSLGALSVICTGLIIILLCRRIWRRFRHEGLHRNVMVFYLGGFALIAVYSITDFRHIALDWRGFWILFAGMCLAEGTPRESATDVLKANQTQAV